MIAKKAFTLVEMILVILIIGVLLLIGLMLSWKTIYSFQASSDKEQVNYAFIKTYSTFLSNPGGKTTITGSIDIVSGAKIIYRKIGSSDDLPLLYSHLTGLIRTGSTAPSRSFSSGHIIFAPYRVGCSFAAESFSESGGALLFGIQAKQKIRHCFRLDLPTCKVSRESCDLLYP